MGKQRLISFSVVIAALFLCTNAAPGADLYVSPEGHPSAAGTPGNPLDLNTALNDPSLVRPGDTVWLLGGTYCGPFTKLALPAGTLLQPITYRAMPEQRVTLTAGDTDTYVLGLANAEYIRFWGLEFTQGGRPELGYTGSAVLWVSGGRESKIINCVIHDSPNRNAIGSFASLGGEYYGNIIYRNGQYASALAHGIYSQNRPEDVGGDLDLLPWKEHRENILFNNFGLGQHSYGTASHLAKMLFVGTVAYGNGLPPGAQKPVLNFLGGGMQYDDLVVVRECFTYFPSSGSFKRGADLGYISARNGRLCIEDSVWVGGLEALWIRRWEQIVFRGNMLHTPSGPVIVLERPVGFDPGFSDVDFNTYFDLPYTTIFWLDGTGYDDLASWTAATGGFDPNSAVCAGPPSERWLFLRPNAYEKNRAHLIIYNWPNSNTVPIDLGAIWNLRPGDEYWFLNVEDVWGSPVAEGVYDGNSIMLTMVGDYAPEFAVYLVKAKRHVLIDGKSLEEPPGDQFQIERKKQSGAAPWYLIQ